MLIVAFALGGRDGIYNYSKWSEKKWNEGFGFWKVAGLIGCLLIDLAMMVEGWREWWLVVLDDMSILASVFCLKLFWLRLGVVVGSGNWMHQKWGRLMNNNVIHYVYTTLVCSIRLVRHHLCSVSVRGVGMEKRGFGPGKWISWKWME